MLSMRSVTKSFSKTSVLKGIDFQLEKGESVLLLGPNGSGKTTLIRLLLDFYKPDEGEVSWMESMGARVGFILQEPSLMDRVTVKELINYIRSLHKNPLTYAEAIHNAGLVEQENVLTERLSVGQKRKLLFALALIGRPELLIMDEPTAGMDLHARRSFYAQVQGLKEEGLTILMTTHLLDEANLLGDRVLLLDQGVITKDQSVASISYEQRTIRFALTDREPYSARLKEKGFRQIERGWELVTSQADELITWLVSEQIPFQQLTIEQQSINDFFESSVRSQH
ncbi:ABC transporter ATP-binding protein [Thalassobacillus sp. CUG 92003]|uniref:ABC transporter ATP-binding protein n=1 Tax=Thalassobacillus sp. CUG 92003 TaxID=2736641 RepID=UPI0021068B51|nr:ABC transporter ATP-binding protein [Thalassobacillus sp. CUG 92003]